MPRPDLATLACVNAECQYVGRLGQGNLAIRTVYAKMVFVCCAVARVGKSSLSDETRPCSIPT